VRLDIWVLSQQGDPACRVVLSCAVVR